jgi:uncharacterized RDD family membrane protein YckC
MQVIQIATPFNIDIEFELAPIHKRLLAYIFDIVLILLYIISMRYLLYTGLNVGEGSRGFVLLILMVPSILYTMSTELLFNGQTIGKKLAQIKVVSLDGGEPTLVQFLLRWFMRFYEWGFIVFFVFQHNGIMGMLVLVVGGIVSIIIIGISGKSQRLGDIVANTVVVNTTSKLTVDDTIFLNIAHKDYKVQFPEVMKLSDRDLNTINNVLIQAKKTNNFEMCNRVAYKVQDVLKVTSDMYALDFLEKIMEDYNYLSTFKSEPISEKIQK